MHKGEFKDGKPHGQWVQWDDDKNLRSEGGYADGRPHGTWTYWHPNGTKASIGDYVEGQPHGRWTWWDDTGHLTQVKMYEFGVRVRTVLYKHGQVVEDIVEP